LANRLFDPDYCFSIGEGRHARPIPIDFVSPIGRALRGERGGFFLKDQRQNEELKRDVL
jgi:hypothetical protein